MPRRPLPALPGDIPLLLPPGWQRSACGVLWRRKRAAPSALTGTLLAHLAALGLPAPEVEILFWPGRAFAFDVAWVGQGIAAEIDGGTWSGGRHTTGAGYERDCTKLNGALLLGWAVFRFTTGMVTDGRAARTLERVVRV